ncbi:MAG: lysylphosphatidylglycerol synthase transmembrane domain-containing protein [Acidimicrobiales bacterium]|nr:lysylphosphatidylglycerol synthase transmembrane domain-containing protein [Acidimicrobiales bacterium]
MSAFKPSFALNAAKFLLPAVIIGILVWRIEPDQWQQLTDQPKHYGLLFAAFLIALMGMCLSFSRWCILVRCQGIELSMLEAFRLGSICFLLSFVSVGSLGGDLFKAIFLARRRPGKRVEAVASVIVDRGSGLYGLLLLVVCGTLLLQPAEVGESVEGLNELKFAACALFGLGTLVLLILVLGGGSVDRMISWGSTWRGVGPMIARVGPSLRAFHAHPFAFGASLLMSVGVQSLFAISVYLVARSLYTNAPNLTEHFVIVPLGMLAAALPITPAGIGVWEGAIAWLYKMVPAVPTAASGTLVALVFDMIRMLLAFFATVFYWTANEEVRQSLEIAEDEAADQTEHGSAPQRVAE